MKLRKACFGYRRETSPEGVRVVLHAKGCRQIIEEGDPGADTTHALSPECFPAWSAAMGVDVLGAEGDSRGACFQAHGSRARGGADKERESSSGPCTGASA